MTRRHCIRNCEPQLGADNVREGRPTMPSLHSALFAPDRERTLRTGVLTLTTSALEVLGKP